MKEILNIIHKTIYQFFDACEDDEEAPMSDKDKLLLEVNKAICNNLKALEQRWISVSERLPETNDDVLVYDRVDVYVARYSREGMQHGWNSSDNKFDVYTPITAWMPLPKPYKAESEDKT